jgi:hypothetical protein
MVTIYVGPERKDFIVHKKLLCESAQFFKGALTRDFEEAHKGEIVMPEDSPGAFSLYVDWIYRTTLPRAIPKSTFIISTTSTSSPRSFVSWS